MIKDIKAFLITWLLSAILVSILGDGRITANILLLNGIVCYVVRLIIERFDNYDD